MPYICANVTKKIRIEETELLKSEIGKLMGLIGKSEQHLMVDIAGGKTIFFKGKTEICAYVDVRIYGKCEYNLKNKFTRAVIDVFEKVLNIKKENIFLTVTEFDNWGMNGELI